MGYLSQMARTFSVLIVIGIVLFPVTTIAGDSAAGKEKSATCQGCHGTDGNSYSELWPNLAGQHVRYISKQIKNFQTGERKDPTMSAMVGGLTETDIEDIAAYFKSQPVKAVDKDYDTSLMNTGRKIYKGGNRYSDVPACAGCHGPNGVGIAPSAFPVVAGQKVEYTIKTLMDFRTGTRKNDPSSIMRNIASRLTDNEIKSVATYISTLR